MKYSFICHGHENVRATHKTTLEFTKDKDLGLEGDCIIGVNASFSLPSLKKFINSLGDNKKIAIGIAIKKNDRPKGRVDVSDDYEIVEKIDCRVNSDFDSGNEIVVRKGDFISDRTFAVNASKAACELNKSLIRFLNQKDSKVMVVFENK